MRNEHRMFVLEKSDVGMPPARFGRIVVRVLGAPFLLLYFWWMRMLERDELAALGDSTLKDVGLTREQVLRKSERSLWDSISSSRRDRASLIWFDWR